MKPLERRRGVVRPSHVMRREVPRGDANGEPRSADDVSVCAPGARTASSRSGGVLMSAPVVSPLERPDGSELLWAGGSELARSGGTLSEVEGELEPCSGSFTTAISRTLFEGASGARKSEPEREFRPACVCVCEHASMSRDGRFLA